MLDCMAMYRLRGSSSFGSVDDITVNQIWKVTFCYSRNGGILKISSRNLKSVSSEIQKYSVSVFRSSLPAVSE